MQPTHLGPYEIRSRLGRGGMGAVYEAIDTTTGRTVAVKVLASHLVEDAGLRRRFEAEIETLKNLRHPGIVRLLAFGEQDDQPYFAMELVPGKSLEQLLRGGRRFSWRETVAVAGEIVRALKAAHDQGVIHRDLKPANLLVIDAPTDPADTAAAPGAAGPRVTVKLADFGIAKLFGGSSHTAQGNIVGTVEYMAPEQASGKPVDHRVDLYALGLVMFAMLTGGPPFRGTQLTEIIDKQRRATPPRVASLAPDVPPELDELVDRLLAKNPAQRPANALALGRLLTAIETLHAPEPPKPATTPRADPAAATAHDGDIASTLPFGGAAGPERGADVDLLAPTRAARPPAPGPQAAGEIGPGTAATAEFTAKGAEGPATALPPESSRLPTDAASAATLVERQTRNRFTTVEEFERNAAAAARREQRRQLLWQSLAALAGLLVMGIVAWQLAKPPSADSLHERIRAVADAPQGDLRDVRDEIETFLARHAADPRAEWVRQRKHSLDLDLLERKARRRLRSEKGLTTLERDYRAALADEENGPSAAARAMEAFLAVHAGGADAGDPDTSLWLDLARRQLARLKPRAEAERGADRQKIAKLLAEAASLAARADIANDDAVRRKFAADRRAVLENLVAVYEDRPHAAEAVAFAKRALAELNAPGGKAASPLAPAPPTTPPQNEE